MAEIHRKEGCERAVELIRREGVDFFKFPLLDALPGFRHGFSTRLGGVSTGCFAAMNLCFTKGDSTENVTENYRRLGAAIGFPWEQAVLSYQTHTTNIRLVTKEDAGKGTTKERDYRDIDGLITNVPGIPLATFYADCVPLYFVDPVNRAIGLSHSGWRGTLNRMGECTLRAMKEAFGTQPEQVFACIGPSICGDCFEVGPEVITAFTERFTPEQMKRIVKPGEGDRSFLDLWEANRVILTEAGILPEYLAVTDVCTRCNPELLYSHRVMGEERGNLGAFLMIEPS